MEKDLAFDIVIPTKNEEINLKLLLQDISEQSLRPNGIIVADKSKDKTPDVANKYGCLVVEGVDDGYIGKARNNGVKNSSSDLIVFLDADVRLLNKYFFEEVINEFTTKKYDVATCLFKAKGNILLKISFSIYNGIKKLGPVLNHIVSDAGTFIIIRRDVLDRAHGFDEDMRNNEDIVFLNRCIKNGANFNVINNYIETSTRRITNKNIFQLIAIGFGALALTILYKFNLNKKSKIARFLEGLYGETGGANPAS